VEGADGRKPKHKWGGLGEILEGNELIDSNMEFRFRHDQPKSTMCVTKLDANDVKKFKRAIRHHYWYEFVMDDLPIWGFVGEHVDEKSTLTGSKSASTSAEAADLMADDVVEHRGGTVYIYTHKTFDVSYNGDRIIGVNLTAENPKPLTPGTDLEFTYSVNWKPTETKFGKRFERYLDYNFFEHQIHWFSIFNSFMMVIFLTGLVSMILMRTLRKDYAKYARDADDMEQGAMDQGASMEESGWKLVHGDVFRAPPTPPRALRSHRHRLPDGVTDPARHPHHHRRDAVRGQGDDHHRVHHVLRAHQLCRRVRQRRVQRQERGQIVDQGYALDRGTVPWDVLRHRVRAQHRRHRLSLPRGCAVRDDGGDIRDVVLHLVPVGALRDSHRS
jgi:hypothetical protein